MLTEIQSEIDKIRNEIISLMNEFDPFNIWNTDQTGFTYEFSSTRTHHGPGKRKQLQFVIQQKIN